MTLTEILELRAELLTIAEGTTSYEEFAASPRAREIHQRLYSEECSLGNFHESMQVMDQIREILELED